MFSLTRNALNKRKNESKTIAKSFTGPVSLTIGHVNHVSRKDTVSLVHGLIRRQFSVPGDCYYKISKTREGFAYEIQEGGDQKPHLPRLLALDKEEDRPIYLRAGNRILHVFYGTTGIESVLLPESEQPDISPLQRKGAMRPYEASGSSGLLTAGVFFVVSGFCLLFALGVTWMASSQWRTRSLATTPIRVSNLPIEHWPTSTQPGRYITKVQYLNGRWSVQHSTPGKKEVTNAPQDH